MIANALLLVTLTRTGQPGLMRLPTSTSVTSVRRPKPAGAGRVVSVGAGAVVSAVGGGVVSVVGGAVVWLVVLSRKSGPRPPQTA